MKITNTTVFRMAVQFAVVFEAITIMALLTVYYTTLLELQNQMDGELRLELGQLADAYQSEGIDKLEDIINQREQYGEHLRHFYALTDSGKNRIAGNELLSKLLASVELDKSEMTFQDISSPGASEEHENLLRIAVMVLPSGHHTIVAQTQGSIIELREHTFITLLIAVVATLFLALLSGAYMGRVVLSGVRRIDEGMDQAIASNFTKKIALPAKNDEFMSLTLKLNLMLDRIERLLIGMRQVTDNVAHDLRSPLTRLRSRLEVTLLKSRSEKEYREIMAQVVDDAGELISTFNALLSIAQAEAKVQRDDWAPIDLSQLLEELAELYAVVAEDKAQSFELIVAANATVQGDRQLLAQAVSNLLENAIKYTEARGDIKITLTMQDQQPVITVSDNGPGIPASDKERVLERFQRLDAARSSPGNGLGLSLVNAIAKLHDATLSLNDNKPGLRVSLIFKRD